MLPKVRLTMLRRTMMSDVEEMVSRCLGGDQNAFRCLVESHQSYAYALAFRMLADADDARDVVQESFVSVWRNLRHYDGTSSFTTWLYRIVVNRSFDRLRARTRERKRLEPLDEAKEERVRAGEAASDDDGKTDLVEQVERFSMKLPPMQRAVFILRDLQDLSVNETAEVLRISPGSVKTNLCYARRSLRDILKSAGILRRGDHDV